MAPARKGRLWILLHVGDPRWRQTFPSDTRSDTAFDGWMDGYFDSILEVIDTGSRSLLARLRLDGYATAFTTAGKLVVYGEDREGPFLDVVSLTLAEGGS